MRRIGWGAALVVAVIAIGCSEGSSGVAGDVEDDPAAVSRAEFGKAWPLTVDQGVLSCDGSGVIFTTPEGDEYGVNGTAKGLGYPEIDPIWKEDRSYDLPGDGPPLRVDISALIDRGLEICQ